MPGQPQSGKRAFLNLGVGSHGLIQRCVLKAGSKTISETADWNYLQDYKSMFIANEAKTEREGVLTGRVGNYGYDVSEKLQLDILRHPDANDELQLQDYQNLENSPTWQVTLSELFPFLKKIQLPLY